MRLILAGFFWLPVHCGLGFIGIENGDALKVSMATVLIIFIIASLTSRFGRPTWKIILRRLGWAMVGVVFAGIWHLLEHAPLVGGDLKSTAGVVILALVALTTLAFILPPAVDQR